MLRRGRRHHGGGAGADGLAGHGGLIQLHFAAADHHHLTHRASYGALSGTARHPHPHRQPPATSPRRVQYVPPLPLHRPHHGGGFRLAGGERHPAHHHFRLDDDDGGGGGAGDGLHPVPGGDEPAAAGHPQGVSEPAAQPHRRAGSVHRYAERLCDRALCAGGRRQHSGADETAGGEQFHRLFPSEHRDLSGDDPAGRETRRHAFV